VWAQYSRQNGSRERRKEERKGGRREGRKEKNEREREREREKESTQARKHASKQEGGNERRNKEEVGSLSGLFWLLSEALSLGKEDVLSTSKGKESFFLFSMPSFSILLNTYNILFH
jgi:hypothetical protein